MKRSPTLNRKLSSLIHLGLILTFAGCVTVPRESTEVYKNYISYQPALFPTPIEARVSVEASATLSQDKYWADMKGVILGFDNMMQAVSEVLQEDIEKSRLFAHVLPAAEPGKTIGRLWW